MADPELLEEVRRPAIGVFPMGAWDPSDASFRKIIGYRDLAKLAVAIEHDLARLGQPDATHSRAEGPRSPQSCEYRTGM